MSARKTKVVTFDAAKVQEILLAAFDSRIETAPNENQKANLSTERNFFSTPNMLAVIEKAHALDIDLTALAAQISITQSQDRHAFIAVYALQKIRKALFAIAQGLRNFDGYTNSILFNLFKNEHLSNKAARASICKAIEFTELEQVYTLRRMHNCSESTASTQASSTRMMLRALNICNVVKGKSHDSITLADTKAAHAVRAMYVTE